MDVLRSIPQLESLRDEWNALADAVGHALLRHEWFLSAARTLHAADELAIVTERDAAGRLAAVAPLVRTRRSGAARLETLGAAALHEPAGFLCPDPARRELLMAQVLALREAVLLQRTVPASLPPLPDGRRASRSGVLLARSGSPCLGVVLNGHGEDYLLHLPGKLRYDVRRARMRAEAAGPVAFECGSPSPREVPSALATFAAVEGSGWKGRRRSALAQNGPLRAFFEMYGTRAAEAGILRIFFLRIGAAVAAAQIAVEVYSRLWVLKIGYDEEVGRCSPGLLLTAEAIAYAGNRGLTSYEFLGSPEPWEERWRPAVRVHRNFMFYPWTPMGCARFSVDAISAALGRVRGAMRAHT